MTGLDSRSNILTATGLVSADRLQIGDLILTEDNDLQPLRWITKRQYPGIGIKSPVEISKGTLGSTDRLRLSSSHRILISGWQAELTFGEAEVLVPIGALCNRGNSIRGIDVNLKYVSLLFDDHQLIRANGVVCESFHLGDTTWTSLTPDERRTIQTMFPHVSEVMPLSYGSAARPALSFAETLSMIELLNGMIA
ncbi:Hint domain-containing protein [Anianabacter salinae]|uniref:Hint domain-containing protein n=1 Tax=Anianabacter salinae TaxID=2851023 RepID=UPI00225E3B4F|nr:Hint domain-containing protein [Anianabacter salinae]MBV0914233.1 Hint domain-containing protein [Anianabacter salinae]